MPNIKELYLGQSPEQIASVRARYAKARELATISKMDPSSYIRWLDIGSNLGIGLPELYGFQVVATDIDPIYLGNNPNYQDKDPINTDGIRLPFPEQCFELISCFEVLEHLDEDGQDKLLRSIASRLKTEGILFLSTPNRITNGKRMCSPDHKRELDIEELRCILLKNGFKIELRLGQGFFKSGNPIHELIKLLRQNEVLAKILYSLPRPIRQRLQSPIHRMQTISDIQTIDDDKNTERIMFIIAKKEI